MKLKDLIKQIDVIKIDGETDIDIMHIDHDSRKIENDSLFIAIKGFIVDGHDFIENAIKNGAKAVLVEKDTDSIEGITIVKVENTREVMAKISSIFFKEPSKKIDIIGITGTNGKTSTTYFIKSIFDAAGKNAGIIGGIGNIINSEIRKTNITTPESLEVQYILHKMVESNVDICAMEASSHALELHRVDYCDFDIGVFSNLTIDHLDYHETIENYLDAKIKLFYKTQRFNIINIDDKYGKEIIKRIEKLSTPVLTYGVNNNAEVYATNIEHSAEGVRFVLNTPKGCTNINMKTPGLFTVYNALAAAACGYTYDIDLEVIKRGLEDIKGVKGRFEVVPTGKNFSVIIDFAHTPDSLEKALVTVSQFAKGRRIVLFGLGGNKYKSKRPIMGEIAAKNSDLCIITSDNPRTEDPESIIKEVLEGVKRANGNYVAIVDRREAIRYAILNSQPNDVILLAGKGHETYTIMGDKKLPFDERKVVLEALVELDNQNILEK